MSFDLVIFGGTGDLAWRKLMPALFQAFRHGKLPGNGRILAVGRHDHTRESYCDWLHQRFSDVGSEKRPDDEEFVRFAKLIHYLRVDLASAGDYEGLAQWLGAEASVRQPTARAVVRPTP